MNEIITIKRDTLKERLPEFFEKQSEHVYIIDLVPTGESTIFCMYPDSEYLIDHTFSTFLDNIKSNILKENEQGITYDKAEDIQNFIFKIRNAKHERPKRLIIACSDGRRVSGAIAIWAMEWLMGENNEEELYKLNPDILPNEFLLRDLYLHPII